MHERHLRLFICLLFFQHLLFGQEVPKVVHFTPRDYQAHAQNWSISQRPDLQLFIGNSGGLLRFDGAGWYLHPSPSGQIVRAVACDAHGRVFIGGYATLGYWAANENGRFEYTSLLDKIEGGLGNEEIWHILDLGGRMLFQSFSVMFLYENGSVRRIEAPGNIMFARKVRGRVIVPVIDAGLFELLPDGSFLRLPGSEGINGKNVSAILPLGEEDLLVCTQKEGIFQLSGGQSIPWQVPFNHSVKTLQLNNGIFLKNGNYAFGTVLNGIFITDPQGEILAHINQENGLQNNTVLSLFEDKANGLWAGLDKGIDLVLYGSPLKYFQDKTGETGTVYAAALFDNKLYLGTNHGIFYKNYPSDKREKFRMLEGSQGQVWDLQVFDGQLIGSHNAGSIRLLPGRRPEFVFNATGVYTTVAHPAQQDALLQGTYTGIVVLRKNTLGIWQMSNGIDGFFQSARSLFFDETNRLWVLHPRRGLFRLTLDTALTRALHIESFGKEHGLPTEYNLDLTSVQGELIVKSGTGFFARDEAARLFVPKTNMGGEKLGQEECRLAGGIGSEWFKIFPTYLQHFNGKKNTLRTPLVRGNERIVSLADSSYLFCLDDGYIILPKASQAPVQEAERMPLPLVTGVFLKKDSLVLNEIAQARQPFSFPPKANNLHFRFACPNFTFQPAMRFRLLGFDKNWSPLQTIYGTEFTNLPPGDYEFQVQSELTDAIASFRFTIRPHWYETPWATLCYLLIGAGAVWFLLKWQDRRLEKQLQKLRTEQERALEQQRIAASNEMLQSEVLNKSRKLADVTMNLVRKNETLIHLKKELELALRTNKNEPAEKAFHKMKQLIEEHLGSEEDWQVFESNFNQLHNQFFNRLKAQYPDLTPGDLRLAAYLKMNISSKEIAPLLNITVRGVENKRYRLRQKMGLDNEVNLTEYLMAY